MWHCAHSYQWTKVDINSALCTNLPCRLHAQAGPASPAALRGVMRNWDSWFPSRPTGAAVSQHGSVKNPTRGPPNCDMALFLPVSGAPVLQMFIRYNLCFLQQGLVECRGREECFCNNSVKQIALGLVFLDTLKFSLSTV